MKPIVVNRRHNENDFLFMVGSEEDLNVKALPILNYIVVLKKSPTVQLSNTDL